MENNLISHELEQMRSQISALKDKLDKQTIINESHIRNSMKSKASDLNRTVGITIFVGVLALVYCTWFFYTQDFSLAFVVSTAVMLTVCILLTIAQKVALGRLDFSQDNLVETAKTLGKVKKLYLYFGGASRTNCSWSKRLALLSSIGCSSGMFTVNYI